MLYGKTGGEGVASVCRYLCSLPHSEKAKRKIWNNLNVEEEDQREASR